MITILAAFALRAGVPVQFARAAGWGALIMLAIALLGIAKCSYDGHVIARHDAAIDAGSNAITATNSAAAATATTERAADAITVAQQQKDQHDAIHSVPDSAPGAARVALNCRRLRAAGYREDDLPAACRPRR